MADSEDKWEHLRSYHCFGCSPKNRSGLRLRWREVDGELLADVKLSRRFESYPGVAHGGIVATILDELMGNAIVAARGIVSLTVTLRVRYVHPLLIDHPYQVRAGVDPGAGPLHQVRGRIETPDGVLAAAASGTYRGISRATIRRVMRDPGLEETAARFLLPEEGEGEDRDERHSAAADRRAP
jgi:acyl-coenzyme A thioesterase PaaI-like protein